jgi:hypothetical protein
MLAAASLGRMGGPEDVEALLASSRIPGGRPDPRPGRKVPYHYNAAARAIEQLGVIGGERAAAELVRLARSGDGDALLSLFNSRDPDCRRAARGLLKEDAAGTMRRLVAASDLQRLNFCAWARTLPARHAVPVLTGDLSSPDAGARSAAAADLSALRIDPRAVAPLAGLASRDPDEAVRLAAVRALRGNWDCLVDPAAAAALLEVKARGTSELLRREATSAIVDAGAAGGPEAAAAIAAYIKEARAAAARDNPQPQPPPGPPEPPEVF